MRVPDDVGRVVDAYRELESQDLQANFVKAHNELDHLVGKALGLSSDQCDYIIECMSHDPFLREIKPMYEHRGLRVQPYADHSGQSRYNFRAGRQQNPVTRLSGAQRVHFARTRPRT